METNLANRSKKTACIVCGQEFHDQSDTCPFDGTKLTIIRDDLAPGAVLADRYEIIGIHADGGMGKVYKAKHKMMNRVVAIKTILSSGMASGAALKRFQLEAQALSSLNHPNILTVFDFFISEDGQPYLVMDYLEGSNLDELRRSSGPLDPERAIKIFVMACAGLAHAHERGIIHRDIKPSNIMLINFAGTSDFVKIIDFGIAKLLPGEFSEHGNLTATGDVFGSPQYMSPEQCRAKPLDARSDVYSLGCVMYSALTGHCPFAAQDPMECMWKQVNDTPPPMRDVCDSLNISDALEEIVIKAMSKEPEDRYQSMDELRLALESMANYPVATSPASTTSGTPQITSATPPPAPDSADETPAKPAGMSKLKISLVAAAAALILVSLGFLALRPASHSPSSPNASPAPEPITPQAPLPPPPVDSSSKPADTVEAPSPQLPQPPASAPAASTPPAPSLEDLYAQQMLQGQQFYKAGRYTQAQACFNSAHDLAANFGQGDPRYIDSMAWQAKVLYQMGAYVQAKQALDWVLYARRSRFGEKSKAVAATKQELARINNALRNR